MNVADLMGSATLRMERVTRAIRSEKMDKLEVAGIPGDIRSLREDYAALDDALFSSCRHLRDNWPAFQNNRGLLYELRLFEDSISTFNKAAQAFDDAVTADEPSALRLLAGL